MLKEIKYNGENIEEIKDFLEENKIDVKKIIEYDSKFVTIITNEKILSVYLDETIRIVNSIDTKED